MGSDKTGLLKTGIIGLILTALCCFTPALVMILGIAGLGMLTGYLDYILLPLLFLFAFVTIYAFVKTKVDVHKKGTINRLK